MIYIVFASNDIPAMNVALIAGGSDHMVCPLSLTKLF